MWYRSMIASASRTRSVAPRVTGSTIIPASERFTLSTSATCSAIERLRWTMPMPPSRASAIASRASVTVSIAAETIGISSVIVGVSRVTVETSFGRTADSAGTSSTSSKVRPSLPNLLSRSNSNSKSRAIVPASSVAAGQPIRVATLHPGWTHCELDESRQAGPPPSDRSDPRQPTSTDAAPAPTASRSASSAGFSSSTAAIHRASSTSPAPSVDTGSSCGESAR